MSFSTSAKRTDVLFFHRNLIRHIRLVGEFDESIIDPSGDDPFLRLKAIEDVELHHAAKDLIASTKPLLEAFYHDALKYKDNPFIMNLCKAAMALFLAANPRNQMQNSMGKPSLCYFFDFHEFLRCALQTEEYHRAVEMSVDQLSPVLSTALTLSSRMAFLFFTRKQSVDLIDHLLLRTFERAGGCPPFTKEGKNPLWLWNSLLDDDDKLRSLLKRYPNGPVMKTLDILREGEEREGFDPFSQGNLPSYLFKVAGGDLSVQVLRLPSPVIQTHIDQVKISDEFLAFLRRLCTKEKEERLLIFNLQDRTSWQEHARSILLENLQKRAEFSSSCYVVTLPMDTEFYAQSASYENLNEAKLFKNQLLEQFSSQGECGYFIPAQLRDADLEGFARRCLDEIHRIFFADKSDLTRKNRLDFIEIFYLFLIVYFVIEVRPDYLSFTCKDAIDTGAVMSACMFSFFKILGSDGHWSEDEKNLLLHLLYVPAFTLRERLVDKARLHRFVSAMSLIQAEKEAKGDELCEMFNNLFTKPLLGLLRISGRD